MTGPRTARRDALLLSLLLLAVLAIPAFGLSGAGFAVLTPLFWLLLIPVHLVFTWSARRVARLYRSGDESRPARAARRFWWCAAFAGAAFLVGDLWQLAEAFRAPASSGGIVGTASSLALLAIGMVAILVGLLRHPAGSADPGQNSRLRLDVATVMAGAATCGMLVAPDPRHVSDPGGAAAYGLGLLIQPGVFLLAIFAVVRLIMSGSMPFSRRTGRLLGGAAVLQSSIQLFPIPMCLDPGTGPWLLGANLAAACLLAISSRVQERQVRLAPDGVARIAAHLYSKLPYAAMAATWVLTLAVLVAAGLTWRTWVVGAGMMITTTLVVGRQVLAFRQIEELLQERDELTARLTDLAFRDGLTGLANRAFFMGELTRSLEGGVPVTVFLVDLDKFKPVNDTYGHATGDRLLIEVGRRLRGCVRSGDAVARLGGDEFAVLVTELPEQRRAELQEALGRALSGSVRIEGRKVPLSASIGMATAGTGEVDPDALLHAADMAMYETKRNGAPPAAITAAESGPIGIGSSRP